MLRQGPIYIEKVTKTKEVRDVHEEGALGYLKDTSLTATEAINLFKERINSMKLQMLDQLSADVTRNARMCAQMLFLREDLGGTNKQVQSLMYAHLVNCGDD